MGTLATADGALISHYQRGSNPLLQTKRGKVQQRRSALNEQISKQIRLRNGAENLLRATSDKKIRDQISLELSFLDSNLQLLKEELSELNADVQIYQNEKCSEKLIIPQFALGLKETKDVDFIVPFKDVIIEHYAEESMKYDAAIRKFSDMRKGIRAPPRNEQGVKLLMEYYNHLCYVEKRFYVYTRPLNTYFEWFDGITGIPAIQRSVAFEKGSVLFNIASLYTQLATNEDRSLQNGLQKSVEFYGRAVGYFYYLKENFSHAPSNDMRAETLDALMHLFLAQSQECVWEICNLQLCNTNGFHESFILAQESSQVSKMYAETCQAFQLVPQKQYLPSTWTLFANLKKDFFTALAHFFTALGIMAMRDTSEEVRKRYKNHFVLRNAAAAAGSNPADTKNHNTKRTPLSVTNGNCAGIGGLNFHSPPENVAEKRLMAKIHLRTACNTLDELLSTVRVNRSLRKFAGLREYVKKYADVISRRQKEFEEDDKSEDYADLYEPEMIAARTTYPASMILPDFKKYHVEDLFKELGPLSVFNAKNNLQSPRTVELNRTPLCPGFGFSVKGDAPVSISSVEPGGLAAFCNLNPGDHIVAVNDESCKWASHDEVVRMIRKAGDNLTLTVIGQKRLSLTSSHSSAHSLSTSTLSSSNSNASCANAATNGSGPAQKLLVKKDHVTNNTSNGQATNHNGGGSSSCWLSSTLPSSFKNGKNKIHKSSKDSGGGGGGEIRENKSESAIVVRNGCSVGSGSGKNPQKAEKPRRKSASWGVRNFLSMKKSNSSTSLPYKSDSNLNIDSTAAV